MECVLENLLRRYRLRRLPENLGSEELVFWSWRRDSNPRPSDYKSDALPTELRQQTLGKGARLRANLSHGSLPDVRDNYIKYHSVKLRRKQLIDPAELNWALAPGQGISGIINAP